MTKIKICGITNKQDAVFAAKLGVELVGFVFYKKSKRYVEPMLAADIMNELPPFVAKAGVFVNETREEVERIAGDLSLDVLQFHGDETPEYCEYFKDKYKVIRAFRIKDKESLKNINDYNTDFYMFDTYSAKKAGGTGKGFDWKILKDFEILKPFFLSGGLVPDNVGQAVRELAPYCVDVSSGVEASPGKKDAQLLKIFVENVRKADL